MTTREQAEALRAQILGQSKPQPKPDTSQAEGVPFHFSWKAEPAAPVKPREDLVMTLPMYPFREPETIAEAAQAMIDAARFPVEGHDYKMTPEDIAALKRLMPYWEPGHPTLERIRGWLELRLTKKQIERVSAVKAFAILRELAQTEKLDGFART